jgi:hypothetical protein
MPTSAATPHLRLVGEGKACECPDLTGVITCATCEGELMVLSKREHLLLSAVVEAARALMTAQLRLERIQGARLETDPELLVADKWQTFRDSLWAQRRARGGAR